MTKLVRKYAAIFGVPMTKAGGPYIGPNGGKWADPKHTTHWEPAHIVMRRDAEARMAAEDAYQARLAQTRADAEKSEHDAIVSAPHSDYDSTRHARIAAEDAAHEAGKNQTVADILAMMPSDFDPDDEPMAGAHEKDALSAAVREYLGSRELPYDVGEIAGRIRAKMSPIAKSFSAIFAPSSRYF